MSSSVILFLLWMLLGNLQPTPAQSSPSPSYEATRDWTVAKINQLGGVKDAGPGQWSVSYKAPSMDNCELKYEVSSVARDGFEGKSLVRIELAKVEIQEQKWEFEDTIPVLAFTTKMQGIHIQRIERRGKVKNAWQDVSGTYSSYGDVAFNSLILARPGTDPNDIYPRMKTALLHAISICKQRYVPPKEPF